MELGLSCTNPQIWLRSKWLSTNIFTVLLFWAHELKKVKLMMLIMFYISPFDVSGGASITSILNSLYCLKPEIDNRTVYFDSIWYDVWVRTPHNRHLWQACSKHTTRTRKRWPYVIRQLCSITLQDIILKLCSYRNSYQYWGHCCLINDLGSSPQPEGEDRVLWWASQVVNETTMTEIEVSISILSWWNQINDE